MTTIGCQELRASLFGFGFQNEGKMFISSCYIFSVSSIFVSCSKTFFCGWIWGMWELGLGQPLSTHTHPHFVICFFVLLRDLQTSTTLLFVISIHYTYKKHQHFFFLCIFRSLPSLNLSCFTFSNLSHIYLKLPFLLLDLLKFERSKTTYAFQISKDPIL
jgi:hypothetical protein